MLEMEPIDRHRGVADSCACELPFLVGPASHESTIFWFAINARHFFRWLSSIRRQTQKNLNSDRLKVVLWVHDNPLASFDLNLKQDRIHKGACIKWLQLIQQIMSWPLTCSFRVVPRAPCKIHIQQHFVSYIGTSSAAGWPLDTTFSASAYCVNHG